MTEQERVRLEAERLHITCAAPEDDVAEAFCACWALACKAVGPCGECYYCRPGGLSERGLEP